MKKILIVSTVSRQFYLFEQGNIEVLKSLGYEVHGAANFEDANERLDALDIIRHPFDIQRSPFSLKNIKAYKQLKKIMKSENFDAVHCHSPVGGVLARLAAKSVGIPTVIYTAHGFHFYKGAPIINWLVYYPIEKLLSKFTDILVTINNEDFLRAEKNFSAKKIFFVPGIGLDTKKFNGIDVNRNIIREKLGIPKNSFVILSVGELNKNKNHEVVIKALSDISKATNINYLICGQGERERYLKELVKSHDLQKKVKFLGYRNDLPEVYQVADAFIFPSYREGLSVSLMEAMASGLPVICSNIRGNKDLIDDGKGGYLVEPDNIKGFSNAISQLLNNQYNSTMGKYNSIKVKSLDKSRIKETMKEIYGQYN